MRQRKEDQFISVIFIAFVGEKETRSRDRHRHESVYEHFATDYGIPCLRYTCELTRDFAGSFKSIRLVRSRGIHPKLFLTVVITPSLLLSSVSFASMPLKLELRDHFQIYALRRRRFLASVGYLRRSCSPPSPSCSCSSPLEYRRKETSTDFKTKMSFVAPYCSLPGELFPPVSPFCKDKWRGFSHHRCVLVHGDLSR
ncbi:hypothetical protein DY000_02020205 [Brassica cretica]|uniref:Uncharacterized protein n=1 Tax=Brassica cretica TaxID=69181 RepID=A0ABQ7EDV9_BRACR|nr:hypothetical protein DY000_02020205 [Brassica cretica]